MAPGASPEIETPPTMYTQNRITSVDAPRAHMYCSEQSQIWMKSNGVLVAGCTKCESDDYFLVPNHHVESLMVGSCFKVDQYVAWVEAVTAAQEGSMAPLKCSIFTNDKGMKTQYFGDSASDVWDSAPKGSPFTPRAFVCTTANTVKDHAVDGDFAQGFRQMSVFSTTVARFVMCHTDRHDGAGMTCVKKTRVGMCNVFKLRNAAFDDQAMYLKTNETAGDNTTYNATANLTQEEQTAQRRTWDKNALQHGTAILAKPVNPVVSTGTVGLATCEQAWTERLLAVHQ